MIRARRSITRFRGRILVKAKCAARSAGPYLAIAAALWGLSAHTGWFTPSSIWAVLATGAFVLAAACTAFDRLGVPRGSRSRNRRRAAAAAMVALGAGVAATAQLPLWIAAAAAPFVIAGHRAHKSARRRLA